MQMPSLLLPVQRLRNGQSNEQNNEISLEKRTICMRSVEIPEVSDEVVSDKKKELKINAAHRRRAAVFFNALLFYLRC